MGLYVCENCGVIENTALGHHWSRKYLEFEDSSKNGMSLCSECIPLKYNDGSKAGTGEWHGKFPKEEFNPSIHESEDYLNIGSDNKIRKV